LDQQGTEDGTGQRRHYGRAEQERDPRHYIRAEVSRATRPVMELKGFRRITLAPGEKRTVTFDLGPEQLSYHGPDMKRVVEPDRFQVMVGGSSDAVKSVALDVMGQ
jgi:beta-glucosidase